MTAILLTEELFARMAPHSGDCVDAEARHLAVDNCEESRCYIVTHNELRRAYDMAGLKW